jgi:carbamoyltransferase
MPKQAFRYCLEAAGLSIADVDCVAFYENPTKKLARQLWSGIVESVTSDPFRFGATRPAHQICDILGFRGKPMFVDHHESHAASSFFYSGFPEAAIMTIDGVGEWATTTYGYGRGADIKLFEEVHFPHSLGLLYSTITDYLGFGVNDGEYKVMGLAPYGDPVYANQMTRLIRVAPNGQHRLDTRYFDFANRRRMYTDALPVLFGAPPREAESEITQFHKDMARSLQVTLEEIVLEKLRYLRQRFASDNLCLAGGVALNCVANGRILRSGIFKQVFVPPAPGDAGGALGAAATAHVRLTGKRITQGALVDAYLGPAYSSSEIESLLRDAKLPAKDFRGNKSGLLSATVDRLANGKVVGWFHGRMEFGPRALGARSIIADPRIAGMRDRINALVKKREDFRPFAPSVLEAKMREHFDLDRSSQFMQFVCKVTSPLDLPAITHVDGSARVQTVNSESNPRFAELIEAFELRTGCPILLNTSFNMRDEPIVRHPAEALQCFIRSGLDSLVLEDFLLDRTDVPDSSIVNSMRLIANSPLSSHVYTFW